MRSVRRLTDFLVPTIVAVCAAAPAFSQANAPLATAAPTTLIPGAWASGEGADACRRAAISYFLSDGTYIVFNRFDGPLHAVGRWRVEGNNVILTHTDAPFPETGAASSEATLALRRLDAALFETANAAGRVRIRTRCAGLVLPPEAKAGQAH